jgi:uncharacterized membrane protein YfcA
MVLAFLAALTIGLSLGLLGSGGSIFTVPILVLVLHRPEKLAVAESLAIVGVIALIGSFPYAFRQQIHWRTVWMFGGAGMLGSYIGACLSSYLSGKIQLLIFGSVMLFVAWTMLKDKNWFETKKAPCSTFLILLSGFLLGKLTGCIGVGGGFIIVPILTMILHLSMYLAIGTSLMIIALNAFTAFVKQVLYLQNLNMSVNGETIFLFSIFGVAGSLIGGMASTYISQNYLKKIFGLIMLVLGIYIFIHLYLVS